MKTNTTILFWAIIVVVCIGPLYMLNARNSMETFIAGIDEYMNIGWGGLDKKPDGHEWRKHPANEPLLNNTVTLMGHDIPDENVKDAALDDGQRQMFLFAKNKCAPECCPSTYSCDKGCVCTTEKQRQLINQRG